MLAFLRCQEHLCSSYEGISSFRKGRIFWYFLATFILLRSIFLLTTRFSNYGFRIGETAIVIHIGVNLLLFKFIFLKILTRIIRFILHLSNYTINFILHYPFVCYFFMLINRRNIISKTAFVPLRCQLYRLGRLPV
jgi:hypothetical protein